MRTITLVGIFFAINVLTAGCGMRVSTEDWTGSYATGASKAQAVSAAAQALSAEGFVVKSTDATTGMIYSEHAMTSSFGLSTSSRVVSGQIFINEKDNQRIISIDVKFPPGSGGGDQNQFFTEFTTLLKNTLPDVTRIQ
jgi:hypothetical protein